MNSDGGAQTWEPGQKNLDVETWTNEFRGAWKEEWAKRSKPRSPDQGAWMKDKLQRKPL